MPFRWEGLSKLLQPDVEERHIRSYVGLVLWVVRNCIASAYADSCNTITGGVNGNQLRVICSSLCAHIERMPQTSAKLDPGFNSRLVNEYSVRERSNYSNELFRIMRQNGKNIKCSFSSMLAYLISPRLKHPNASEEEWVEAFPAEDYWGSLADDIATSVVLTKPSSPYIDTSDWLCYSTTDGMSLSESPIMVKNTKLIA